MPNEPILEVLSTAVKYMPGECSIDALKIKERELSLKEY
jgi:hypothetical protein